MGSLVPCVIPAVDSTAYSCAHRAETVDGQVMMDKSVKRVAREIGCATD